MKRRGLAGLLFGAAISALKARAQATPNQEKGTGYVRPPMGGTPVNNQCPVCSTMAPPYHAEPLTDSDGHVIMKPAKTRRTECVYCRVVFMQIIEE